MRRKAVIVICPGARGTRGFLPGAEADAKLYTEFLCSLAGGAWNLSEITVLRNPTTVDVGQCIGRLRCDYAFVVFSGHGWIGEENYIELVDNDHAPVTVLRTGAPRQTIIIDACRTHVREVYTESREDESVAQLGGRRDRSAFLRSRAIFEAAVGKAELGTIPVFSCSPGEEAGETARGSNFARSLIDSALEWRASRPNAQALGIDNATGRAAQKIRTRFLHIQSPQVHPGRRHYPFPFCISAGSMR